MTGILCVGAGGALGAMGRYSLGLIPLGGELPLMTLLINFLGSVAIGAIVETSELAAGALAREAVLYLKVGLCGAFTTFSTFSLETLELIEGGQYAIAGAYALVSVVLCVAGVLVGTGIGYVLDMLAGTKPVLLSVFVLLGGAAGFLNMYRTVKDEEKRNG